MADFLISNAVPEDADRLYEIECACFAIPWSKASLASFISNTAHSFCLTARECGQDTANILGYVGMQHVLDEGEIANIAVHPDYQGMGIGFALLKAVLDYCRAHGIHTVHLEVRQGNMNARALYSKCGFVQTGMRRAYYADNGEDALLYSWKDVSYSQ